MTSTDLSTARKNVLQAIMDDSTPPFKGAPLARIQAGLRNDGYIDADGKLTEDALEALGYPKVAAAIKAKKAKVAPEQDQRPRDYKGRLTPKSIANQTVGGIGFESETEEAFHKRIADSVPVEVNRANARIAARAKTPKQASDPKPAKKAKSLATRAANAVSVFSTCGVEMGYYEPYEETLSGAVIFTFYRAFVIVPDQAPVKIHENGTQIDSTQKVIAAQYNKRNGVSLARKKD